MACIFFIGFLLGVFIPAAASRFGKVDLIDPGTILLHLWHTPVTVSKKMKKSHRYPLRQHLTNVFYFRSVCWGFILGTLGVLSFSLTPFGTWLFPAIVCLCYLIAIDAQHYVLPDFFTLPLLLLGVSAAVFGGLLSPEASLIGAAYGYGVSVLAVLVIALKKESEFGAGDVKLLTALGSWLGVEGLIYTIILSCIFFTAETLCRHRRWGAYGPSLGTAALIILFYFYVK